MIIGIQKTKLIICFVFLSIIFAFLLLPLTVGAQGNGVDISKSIQENIGCSGVDCNFCNVVQGANTILAFLIYFAGIIAVLLFVYAGSLLIFAGGNPTQMQKAKGIFTNVVIGFILAISGFLIIDTILKSFLTSNTYQLGPWNGVDCSNLISPPGGGGTGGTPITPVIPGGGASNLTHNDVRGLLNGAIAVKNGVNLAGVQPKIIDELNRLQSTCVTCNITITSATEGNHNCSSSGFNHCNGWKIDLRSNTTGATLTNFVKKNYQFVGVRGDGARMYRQGDFIYALESDHWDIAYSKR